MKTREIRKLFLDFFAQAGHTIVPSSSLIPGNDPTLLFTNAGMVQFKDTFLGDEVRDYSRATSSQRCVRAGGKHNDLENVGYTARHHTFFEMLGNFSFGDYFKEEAISFAWQFITEVLKIPEDKLWVTVYEKDDEAEKIWLEKIGVKKDRISRCGEKDNFWAMGDVGPCGPCTEIFYDHGEDVPGGPPGTPEEDGDRYIEIWNLVFMQYNRDKSGELHPLPKPSVDTGMGLERIAAVMQGVHSNYEIDLFQALITSIANELDTKDQSHSSLKVIADHLRACSFLVIDGVLPGNDGRGYVLRRIMRRAIRHGRKLGATEPFFFKLVPSLVREMKDAYPELLDMQDKIEKSFLKEEEQFARTIEQGMSILEGIISKAKTSKMISGKDAFILYDTYGFPVDLTADVARESDIAVDIDAFNVCMNEQRERARAHSGFSAQEKVNTNANTSFLGYETTNDSAKVIEIFQDMKATESLNNTGVASIILDKTPFYGESGGQVGDTGRIIGDSFIFNVFDTQVSKDATIHIGNLEHGEVKVNSVVRAEVDASRRQSIKLHHSATHLLHAALRNILGEHVFQKGSVVAPDKLRFDFSHDAPLTSVEINNIEMEVNKKILENSAIKTEVMSIEDAKSAGAMALFGEKYADDVRVLTMGEGYSVELCGGTHASRTGDIGLFKVVAESGVAAGVRRIEAVAGMYALDYISNIQAALNTTAEVIKSSTSGVVEKAEQLVAKVKSQDKTIASLQKELAAGGNASGDNIAEVKGVKLLVKKLPFADAKALREAVDNYKNKLGHGVVVLAAINDGKINLAVGVTKDLTSRLKAGELANFIAVQVGGKGGGRPDMAMAGGVDASSLPKALDSVAQWLDTALA